MSVCVWVGGCKGEGALSILMLSLQNTAIFKKPNFNIFESLMSADL